MTEDARIADAEHPIDAESMSEDEKAEAAEIRADIEEKRLEMGSTLNELGDRLEPGRLLDQAKHTVREATVGRVENTVRGTSEMVLETIKRNPIPAALAGTGLAMLWKNRSQGSPSNRDLGHIPDYGYPSRPANMYSGEGDRGVGSTVGDAASKVGDVASTVGQTVGDAVGSVAGGAQQATGQVIGRAGATAEQVGWKLDNFMRANPLAMGAIAVGVGAVLGSLLPGTEQEREILGDASREVSSTMSDTVRQATVKAEEKLDIAAESVSSQT